MSDNEDQTDNEVTGEREASLVSTQDEEDVDYDFLEGLAAMEAMGEMGDPELDALVRIQVPRGRGGTQARGAGPPRNARVPQRPAHYWRNGHAPSRLALTP